jgi:hypothetical protein
MALSPPSRSSIIRRFGTNQKSTPVVPWNRNRTKITSKENCSTFLFLFDAFGGRVAHTSAIIDVLITDVDAKSNRSKAPNKVLASSRAHKKREIRRSILRNASNNVGPLVSIRCIYGCLLEADSPAKKPKNFPPCWSMLERAALPSSAEPLLSDLVFLRRAK